MRAAWHGCRTIYATTRPGYEREVSEAEPEATIQVVPEGNLTRPLALIRQLAAISWLLIRHHPDVVVTTGAAPGYFAIRMGRLFGISTIWIDSIANAGELSLSGKRAGPHADLWLTQWKHLSGTPAGPQYEGAVL
ncbi:MAG: UDP-N-acetylglucosamine--LPS N-acetylglucosamine transferase [Pseudomonadota bacterium]